jgi:ribosomal 30S subunit maturation factor RimM
MITVKNNLPQSQSIGGLSLPVDGELKVQEVTDEIQRLASRGHVIIVEAEEKAVANKTVGEKTGKESQN